MPSRRARLDGVDVSVPRASSAALSATLESFSLPSAPVAQMRLEIQTLAGSAQPGMNVCDTISSDSLLIFGINLFVFHMVSGPQDMFTTEKALFLATSQPEKVPLSSHQHEWLLPLYSVTALVPTLHLHGQIPES